MKSSLPPSTPEEDIAFLDKCCPEVFDEDETLIEDEDDDDEYMEHSRCQELDEHYAMKAYGFVSRAEQQEIYQRFTRLRGVLSEEFCAVRDKIRGRQTTFMHEVLDLEDNDDE